MIKRFLMGQNALDYLKNNYPDIYERTMNIKKAYELELETEQLINARYLSRNLVRTPPTPEGWLIDQVHRCGASL